MLEANLIELSTGTHGPHLLWQNLPGIHVRWGQLVPSCDKIELFS